MIRTEKEVFYLNDFYNLLYEKENTMTHRGEDIPEYFEREKYYTMGPGIDFPMIMTYKDTENPNFNLHFYFLNRHNDVEIAMLSLATGFDTDLHFNRMRYYNPNLGRFNIKYNNVIYFWISLY